MTLGRTHSFLVALGVTFVLAGTSATAMSSRAPSTPVATPSASPVAAGECGDLAGYFAQVSDLAKANAGLAAMQEAGHDVLSLDDAAAALVVVEIDNLIVSIQALAAPEPARAWQAAYLDLLRWYRDMAASRDPIALQQVINNDRRLFVNLSTAVLSGQLACPGSWDPAWSDAFGDS